MFSPTELNRRVLIFIHKANKFVQSTHLLKAEMTMNEMNCDFRYPVTIIYEKSYKLFVVLSILLIFDEVCDVEGEIQNK